jgi:hypothetical protein
MKNIILELRSDDELVLLNTLDLNDFTMLGRHAYYCERSEALEAISDILKSHDYYSLDKDIVGEYIFIGENAKQIITDDLCKVIAELLKKKDNSKIDKIKQILNNHGNIMVCCNDETVISLDELARTGLSGRYYIGNIYMENI